MAGWTNYIGKQVSIIFDDGQNISTKTGCLIEATDSFVKINTNGIEQMIMANRIVRVELKADWGRE